MLRLVFKWLAWFVVAFVVVLVVGGEGGMFLIQIPFALALGWIGFLAQNLETLELNALLLAEGAACVLALGVGGHYFARWLYREMAPQAPQPWRRSWTVLGLAAVLLLFVAGIATIGITHQTAWLFTSSGPLLEDSWTVRSRVTAAMVAASPLRDAVSDAFEKIGRLPASDAEAGITQPFAPTREVKSASVGPGGVVRVEVTEYVAREGGEIRFTPVPAAGKLEWRCRATLPQKYLPGSCRE